MFKSANRDLLEYIDARKILPNLNQEDLFAKYTGIWPDLRKRYKSLFRPDKNPDCRFKYHDGILFFIDNAGVRGRLSFNIADTIAEIKGITFKEALNIIIKEADIDLNVDYSIKKSIKSKIDIKFKAKEWPKDNYFKIDPYHLYEENVYLVNDYWIKKDSDYEWNHLHNPKKTLTIAYYFPDSDNVKLYFPEQTVMKWYTNCDQFDVFGKNKLNYYLEKDDRFIIITKSQKDRLILDYVYGYNAIAMQNEKINFDPVIDKIKMFKEQLILFDNDTTGQTQASIFSEKYNIPWANIEVAKDPYEAHIKYKSLCKKISN